MPACRHACYHRSMAQMTWRADDAVVEQVRRAAQREGQSMNEYVTSVLRAASDLQWAATEAERIRGQLRRAGLAVRGASQSPTEPPDPAALAEAARAAATGMPLSEIVINNR